MIRTLIIAAIGIFSLPVFAENGLPDRPFVEVSGQGVISAKPDYVQADIVMTAIAEDGATARKKVDAKIAEMAKILQAQKVPKDALEAYQLSIEAEREYINDKMELIGYRATRRATLTIRDLDRAQEILDALIEAPIELWEDIEAHVDNPDEFRERAIISALENARHRAEVYAKSTGKRVGAVYRIGDEIQWDTHWLGNVTVVGAAIGQAGLPLFQVGDIEITQRVHVIYLLE